jgi:hypothetical protein
MKKTLILGLISLLLVMSIFGVVSANDLTADSYKAIAADYTQRLIVSYGPVPVYDQNGTVIEKGISGKLTDSQDMKNWYKSMGSIVDNTQETIEKRGLYYPKGPVVSYGYDLLGTISVGIDKKSQLTAEAQNEIYQIIKSESEKQGFDNVPVIFVSDEIPRLAAERTDSWRPIIGSVMCVGGYNGQNYVRGTTGFAATRNGQNGIIVPGHMGAVGSTVYQPTPSNSIGSITVSSGGRNSDAAWVSNSNVDSKIFEFSWAQPSVYGYSDPWVNLNVVMSGATSGTTNGIVVKETRLYNSYFGTVLTHQYYASFPSAGGDSGASVYYKDSQHRIRLVGTFWGIASYSTFSPISSVMSDLSVTPIY